MKQWILFIDGDFNIMAKEEFRGGLISSFYFEKLQNDVKIDPFMTRQLWGFILRISVWFWLGSRDDNQANMEMPMH